MEEILNDIIKISENAGKIIMDYYDKDYNVTKKADDSPVTTADYESQKYIISELERFNYPIIAEEGSLEDIGSNIRYHWLVDPLDGTHHFIDKTGEFSVLIALMEYNNPILGVIHIPVKKETYYAIEGKGSYLIKKSNIRRIHVSKNDMENIRLITSKKNESIPNKIAEKIKPIKRLFVGGTGIKIVNIAKGEFDLNIRQNPYIKEWDTAAGEIIIRESGGMITDYEGNRLKYDYGKSKRENNLIVSNGVFHDKIIDMIKKIQ